VVAAQNLVGIIPVLPATLKVVQGAFDLFDLLADVLLVQLGADWDLNTAHDVVSMSAQSPGSG
jgi:hypothetical protein